MTHLSTLHTLLDENRHLRAQRDELQRDCTRFEQEARDARAELRKIRAAPTEAEREERDAKRTRDSDAETVADLFTVGMTGIGRRVVVPHSIPPVTGTVKLIDMRDGDVLCGVMGDDGHLLSMSYHPEELRLVKEHTPAAIPSRPKCEDRPAFVASPVVDAPHIEPPRPTVVWSAGPMHNQWRLLDGGDVLGLSWRETALGEYRGRAYLNGYTWINVTGDSAKSCAEEVVRVLSRSGLLEGISVDRSALEDSAKPAEEQPAYVARWERGDGYFKNWTLKQGGTWVIHMYDGQDKREETSGTGPHGFYVMHGDVVAEGATALECAENGERFARGCGWLRDGPIDRSALE